MKIYLHAFAMTQSMFCAIPCPWQIWDEKARSKMLLFLPVVGLEIGLLWAALAWLTTYFTVPAMLRSFLLCAFPYLITGFIHLDGFMDVTDAVGSWQDVDKRREILKDSHVGSFAVIGCGLALLAGFAAFSSADGTPWILLFVPVVSRCCSALAVTVLNPMHTSQYAAQQYPKSHVIIPSMIAALAVLGGFLLWGKYGFVLLGCLAGYAAALRRGYKALDGMNGDISGYALTLSEICAAVVYALL